MSTKMIKRFAAVVSLIILLIPPSVVFGEEETTSRAIISTTTKPLGINPSDLPGVFLIQRASTGTDQIVSMRPDGTEERILSNKTYGGLGAKQSYDGKKIAFTSWHPLGETEILVINSDGSDEINITNNSAPDVFPSWSPSGEIVFSSNRRSGYALYITNEDGSNLRHLPNTWGYSQMPAWSPNGSTIAYTFCPGDTFGCINPEYPPQLYLIGTDGLNNRRIADLRGVSMPSWAPDSWRIVFSAHRRPRDTQTAEIYTINADGTGLAQLTSDNYTDLYPVWSPDGQYIAFTSYHEGKHQIRVMTADGKNVTVIRETDFEEFIGSWVIPAPKPPIVLVRGIGAEFNPSLMISGILDQWFPTVSDYDGLIAALKSEGYVEGQTLFIVNKDWRRPLGEIANNYLAPVINEALAKNPGVNKVVAIGHSQGVNIIAKYLADLIDQGKEPTVVDFIAIAGPTQGANKVYPIWEAGVMPSDDLVISVALSGLRKIYMEWRPDLNVREVIQYFVPSVKDLLPIYPYLKRNGNPVPIGAVIEQNQTLKELAEKFPSITQQVNVYNIVGVSSPTERWINVGDRDLFDQILGHWNDGKPISRETSSGDGTVMDFSATISGARELIVLNADHKEVVAAIPNIFRILGLRLVGGFSSPKDVNFLYAYSVGPGQLSISARGAASLQDNPEWIQSFSGANSSLIYIHNPRPGGYQLMVTGTGSGTVEVGANNALTNEEIVKQEITVSSGSITTVVVPDDSYTKPFRLYLPIVVMSKESHSRR